MLLALLTAVAYGVITSLFWLPYGLNVGDYSDLWVFYHDIERGLLPLIVPSDPRPFMLVPTYLARALTPDSFVALNLILIGVLAAKALAVYGMVRALLPRQAGIAFALGALYLVFPADTGLFWRVTVNIHFMTLAALSAAALWLWTVRRPIRWAWPLIAGGQMIALSYEATLVPLLLVPALSLVITRPTRRSLRLIGLWYAAPVVLVLRYLALISGGGTAGYQAGLLAVDLGAMITSLARMFRWLLVDSWIAGAVTLPATLTPRSVVLALAVGGIVGGVTLAHLRRESPPSRRAAVSLIGIGMIGIVVGVVAVLPTVLRDINYRVYFLAALGAAAVIVGAILMIGGVGRRVRQVAFIVGISAAFALASRLPIAAASAAALALLLPWRVWVAGTLAAVTALGAALLIEQHGRYAAMTAPQAWIMGEIAAAAPGIAPDSVVVLLEAPERLGYAAFEWQRTVFNAALGYTYGRADLTAVVCIPDGSVYGFYAEACGFTPDGLRFTWTGGDDLYPFDRLVLLAYDHANGVTLLPSDDRAPGYDPVGRVDTAAPLPPRLQTLFSAFPAPRPEVWLRPDRLR